MINKTNYNILIEDRAIRVYKLCESKLCCKNNLNNFNRL